MGLIVCCAAFALALVMAWRSTLAGLGSLLVTGYLFGIVRANYPDVYSHFIFDAAVLGFYLSYFTKSWPRPRSSSESDALKWTGILVGWACLMFLIPVQHPLIQLVGLRGNAFLIPFLIIGSRLSDQDGRSLAITLASLNLVALIFGMAEFVVGVPAFFPENAVTEIIYRSKDVAGFTAFRIPACFANAHAYAGTMVISLPWLVGSWIQRDESGWRRIVLSAGSAAAIVGVFMAGARTPVFQLACLLVVVTFFARISAGLWLGWLLMLGGVGYLVSGEERLQRFLTVQNTDEVMGRVEGSVNMNLLELLTNYPLGNGLGGGGTSIPHFLQHLIKNPVGMENEYCRILLEQGVVGLALWAAFMIWLASRSAPAGSRPWALGWRLLWVYCLTSFLLAFIGTGMLTAIPQTPLLFLGMGFLLGPRTAPARRPRTHLNHRGTEGTEKTQGIGERIHGT